MRSEISLVGEGETTNETKDLTLVEASQANPPPPPPSLDPPSTSSTNPPSPPISAVPTPETQSPHMTSSTASQLARLFSLIGQLQSANEAQLKINEAQLSTNARLSSENETLRRTLEDQERVIEELSRSSDDGGFWVWESAKEGKEGGRWLCSREKYTASPLIVAPHAGPPTSFESLPVELADMITSLLPRSDQLSLSLCSFGMLSRAARSIYGSKVKLDSESAALFISARTTEPAETSTRIRSLLVAPLLKVSRRNFDASDLTSLVGFPSRIPPFAINRLEIRIIPPLQSSLTAWAPFLNLVNPLSLRLESRSTSTLHLAPATASIDDDALLGTRRWSRLGRFSAGGKGSVPTVGPLSQRKRFGMTIPLLRRSRSWKLKLELCTSLVDGVETEEIEIDEEDLAELKKRPSITRPVGPFLLVTRVRMSQKEQEEAEEEEEKTRKREKEEAELASA